MIPKRTAWSISSFAIVHILFHSGCTCLSIACQPSIPQYTHSLLHDRKPGIAKTPPLPTCGLRKLAYGIPAKQKLLSGILVLCTTQSSHHDYGGDAWDSAPARDARK